MGEGLFIFEPPSKDPAGECLMLKFWWLKANEHMGQIDFTSAPLLPDNYDPREVRLGLHNLLTDQPLHSGDVITLMTPDPSTYLFLIPVFSNSSGCSRE